MQFCKQLAMYDKVTFKLATEFPVEGFGVDDVVHWEDIKLSKSTTKNGNISD